MANRTPQPLSDTSSQVKFESTNVDGGEVAEVARRKDSVIDPSLENHDIVMAQEDANSELMEELFGPPSEEDISGIIDNQNLPAQELSSNGGVHADVMQVDEEFTSAVAGRNAKEETQQSTANEKRDSKSDESILPSQKSSQQSTAEAPVQGKQRDDTTAAPQEDHPSEVPIQSNPNFGSQSASSQSANPIGDGTTREQNGAIASNDRYATAASQNQVQMGPPNSPAPANGQSREMPPPTAPASMLYNIRASGTAKRPKEQYKDPYVCARLASVVVTLFRMGKAKEAKAIGQFAVDLMGEESWDEWLPEYMDEPPGKDDSDWVMSFLEDVALALKAVDPASSGFLSILTSFLG